MALSEGVVPGASLLPAYGLPLNATDPAKGQVRAAPADDISAQRIFVHQVFGLVA